MTSVRIINQSSNPLPEYQTQGSAGLDLHASLEQDLVLHPMERQLVSTGLYIELPTGFEAQIRPRSGMAFKHGITLPNAPATIDSDYRGEIKVALINLSSTSFTIRNGDRIAQMVIARFERINWQLSTNLSESERGTGGFGHTGIQLNS